MPSTPESLQKFVQYCQQLKGDEKGESQNFLDRYSRRWRLWQYLIRRDTKSREYTATRLPIEKCDRS